MSKRGWLTTMALVSGVLLALAGMAWWLFRAPTRPEWTTADGTKIQFIKLTLGPKGMPMWDDWRDRIFPVMPRFLRGKLNWQPPTYQPATNELVAWVKIVNLPANFNPRGALRLAVVDTNGIEAEPIDSTHAATNGITAFLLNNYPRRSAEFTLRFYGDASRTASAAKLGECRVLNPAPIKSADWKSEMFPAVRETNGIKFVWKSWLIGYPTAMQLSGSMTNRGNGTSHARLEILDHDQPANRNWHLHIVTGSAASGQNVTAQLGRYNIVGPESDLQFDGGYWPEEGWKMTVEASRTRNYPPEDHWAPSHISLPQPGTVARLAWVTNLNGAKIELVCVTAPDAKPPGTWPPFGDAFLTNYAFWFRTSGPGPDARLESPMIYDEEGGRIPVIRQGFSPQGVTTGGERGSIWVLGVTSPQSAKTLRIDVVVSRVYSLEFLVKPAVVK